MIFKAKYIKLIAITVLFSSVAHHQSYASESSDRAEVDAIMINAAKQANEQLVGMKVDEHTRIRFIGFDKNVPVYIYIYSTSIDIDQLNLEQKRAMDIFHINKICTSKFRSLMKNPYNLKVSHEFENIRTGKRIHKIIIENKDCS